MSTYKIGYNWVVDEMKGFRLYLSQIKDRMLISNEEVKIIEEYLEYPKEDILVLIPGYNISWFGKMKLIENFKSNDEQDPLKCISIKEDKPLWKMYKMDFRCGSVYMISWQVFVDFLNEENLDFPKYMNVSIRKKKDLTLHELLYR